MTIRLYIHHEDLDKLQDLLKFPLANNKGKIKAYRNISTDISEIKNNYFEINLGYDEFCSIEDYLSLDSNSIL